ncbi:MAG TPA: glutamate racemase [Candidatus Acidoferrales bacterium]|nr:glutamate racemase [Candidatus Acidoferrales bacterium]
MIGLFDSGLGGLTVIRRLRERLPDVDVLFFADQAHVPYGGRAPDDLHALLQSNLAWLDERGVEAIVMACNTSCAIADLYGWPSTRAEIFDLLDSATIALQHARARRIGVVATEATVRSGAYGRRIRNSIHDGEVWEVAAPELVPLVEAGEHDSDAAREAVARACAALPPELDAVVYGCTHYPVLARHFRAALGERLPLVDPAFVQAERLAEFLALDEAPAGSGMTRYVTSGDPERFRLSVARIMEEEPVIVTLSP